VGVTALSMGLRILPDWTARWFMVKVSIIRQKPLFRREGNENLRSPNAHTRLRRLTRRQSRKKIPGRNIRKRPGRPRLPPISEAVERKRSRATATEKRCSEAVLFPQGITAPEAIIRLRGQQNRMEKKIQTIAALISSSAAWRRPQSKLRGGPHFHRFHGRKTLRGRKRTTKFIGGWEPGNHARA